MIAGNDKGFSRFLFQFLKDVKQWGFYILLLTLFRVLFLILFRAKINAASTASDVLVTLLTGFRFDSMVATVWFLPPFLASIASGFFDTGRFNHRFRRSVGILFIVFTSIAWIFTFVYFKEYNEQFNYLIFNLYYDDAGAILKTIWADYHPLRVFFMIGVAVAGSLAMLIRTHKRSLVPDQTVAGRTFPLFVKVLITLLIFCLIIVASRGSLGRRPAQRKDVSVNQDEFLNKAVINPYFALLFAIQDHELQAGLAGLATYLPDQDVRKAARKLFNNPLPYDNLDEYLLKRAAGPKGIPPRHIFLVVMESYDGWPFLPKYASLQVTGSLSRLGKNGLFFKNFLPASDGTMQSLSAIITGIPYTHVEINYQFTARKPYPSSIAEAFKGLGYRTRLFYGGYLSWQRFGDFARDQGFEEIYGAPHMSKGVPTHEWGVDDEYLFDFINRTVTDDKPSFNLIMTTSYHPPYNVDVEGKGFPLKAVPSDLAPVFDGTTSLRMLGHLWYSDKCIGDFVQREETGLTRPLFAFTGDHFGRKFINANPDFFESSAVPFVLYGRDALQGVRMPKGAAGSHIDIGPTLIELAAPKGYEYYSVGQDLLVPRKRALGIGFGRIIGKDFLFDAGKKTFHPIPGAVLPKTLPDAVELRDLFDCAYGVGWWRVRRGEKL